MAGPVLVGRATPTAEGCKGYAAWLVRLNASRANNGAYPGCSAAAEAQSAVASRVRVVIIGMVLRVRLCSPRRNEVLNCNLSFRWAHGL